MNKFLPTTGGHNLRLDEFQLIQNAYLDGFKALLLKFAPTGNAVLDGVIIDTSGVNVVHTSGYVAINSEIYKVDSNSFPKSLNPSDVLYFKPIETTITPSSPVIYEDTTSHIVHVERKVELRYKLVSDSDGCLVTAMSYPGSVLEGSFIAWLPPAGTVVSDYFDSTGLGINAARGYAICNGANGTVDLRGFYLAQATNVPYAGFGSLSGLLDGITSNPGVAYGHNKIALTQANLPNVNFTVTGTAASAGAHVHSINQAANHGQGSASGAGKNLEIDNDDDYWSNRYMKAGEGAHTHTVSGTAASGGSGTGHENTPATFPVYYITKLRA